MDKRFFNLFNLTEAQAIEILNTPRQQLDPEDRYIAASHLVNCPSTAAIQALIAAVGNQDDDLDNRIVRRKAVESLGRLQATAALPAIAACLSSEDCYLVENSVWAIGEIGTADAAVLEAIARTLQRPGQIYRVVIQTLAKLNYLPALERVQDFVEAGDQPTRSAAIATVCRFTGDYTPIAEVVALLQHPNVNARRGCIQDLIDARYYAAIPQIARCPVSLVFRLRALRLLAEAGVPAGEITFAQIAADLDRVIRDHPQTLDLVHQYDQPPSIEFLVRELYDIDFGRCYLATQTLLEHDPEAVGAALMENYAAEAYNDYGAHYHVMKLFGWLRNAAADDLLLEALHNREPQFQKSRAAAAIALGELGDRRAIPALLQALDTKIWDLKYAALLALEQLGESQGQQIAAQDDDWLVRSRATWKS